MHLTFQNTVVGVFTTLMYEFPVGYMLLCCLATLNVLYCFTTGGNSAIMDTWKNRNSSVVVALHIIFNFGGVISPLVAAPFLSRSPPNKTHLAEESNRLSYSSSDDNTSAVIYSNFTEELSIKSNSKIYIPYSFSALICIITSLSFVFILKSEHKEKNRAEIDLNIQPVNKDVELNTAPLYFKCISLFIMVFLVTCSNGIDVGFSSYLVTFCVEELKWTITTGSVLTSLSQIAVVIGGTCGIFLTKFIQTLIYEGIHCSLLCVSFVGLLISVIYQLSVGIWIFCFLFGFSKSVIFPLVLTWTNSTFVPVNAKIASVFFVGAMGGSAINPLILGYLMLRYTNMWFCYLCLIESVVIILLFVVAVTLTKVAKTKYKNAPQEVLICIPDPDPQPSVKNDTLIPK